MLTVAELARRTEDSYQWWMHHRDMPSDLEKQCLVTKKAVNDVYALFAHYLELLHEVELRLPGRSLYTPRELTYKGDLKKLG